ncbi:MAG: NAD-dependent protein deacylase [Anaerolineae bacterium]|nr:NAD-dependent protein deacylase [Anaerolineae bacterium]
MSSTVIERAAFLLSQCSQPSAFTGAGISKESGLPTYRDSSDALWNDPKIRRLATVAGLHETPDEVRRYFASFRAQVQAARPNAGHDALFELEAWSLGLPIITQNVDDLHERAGSRQVIHLHGNVLQDRCSRYCRGVPSVVETGEGVVTCPWCGAATRPNVTLFGEYVHGEPLSLATQVAEQTDLMLIVGTTGIVAPALDIPKTARQSGATLIEINPNPTAVTPLVDLAIPMSAGEALPLIVRAFLQMIA